MKRSVEAEIANLQTPGAASAESLPRAQDYAVAGPVDRESFRAAQLRNRRNTWRLSALCLLTVVLMGIPLAAVISPFVVAGLILGADLVNHVHRVPDLATAVLHEWGNAANNPAASPALVVRNIALLLMPGMVFMMLVWLLVRSVFMRSGVGGVLLSLHAREPRADRFDETVLSHVGTEMGVAAAVKPPRLSLVDLESANAAAVGSSLDDSVLVVSRGLLTHLDREELQGAIAHFVGSVGNGDLHAAMEMLSLFQTVGMIGTLMETPFGPRSRALMGKLLAIVFRRKRSAGASETEAVGELFAEALEPSDKDDIAEFQKTHGERLGIRGVLLLPLMLSYLAFQLTEMVFNVWFLGPLLALMWRTRRYLADAMAVQLTRNPQGLARALLHLADPRTPTMIAAGVNMQHLFLTWSGYGKRRALGEATLMSFQPPLDKRVRRLIAMGAHVDIPPPTALWRQWFAVVEKLGPWGRLIAWLVSGLLLTLIVVLFPLSLVLVSMMVCVSLMVDMMLMLPVLIPLHYLLRHILTGS